MKELGLDTLFSIKHHAGTLSDSKPGVTSWVVGPASLLRPDESVALSGGQGAEETR